MATRAAVNFEIKDFERQVAEHRMQVIQDNGVHRHLIFKRPDSSNMYFGLVTWPGYLCYYGDMGTYVFSRVEDMFTFFRKPDDPERFHSISYGYWAEKMQAVNASSARGHDAGGGYKVWSPELFKAAIEADFRSHFDLEEGQPLDQGEHAELWADVQRCVLARADDGYYEAVKAAMEFDHDGSQLFPDFYESLLHEYDHHFLWCCHAMRWAIDLYDLTPKPVETM